MSVAGDEANQEAALKGHHEHHQQDEPEADPHTAHNVLQAIRFTKLQGSQRELGLPKLIQAPCIRQMGSGASYRVTVGPEQSYREEGFLKHKQGS